jgi:hypothetical protein
MVGCVSGLHVPGGTMKMRIRIFTSVSYCDSVWPEV